MRYLKTNTSTRVTVGPFLDVADAKTPEVALTATNEKITFVVDDAGVPTLVLDANATASGGNNDMVHITGDDAGYYDLELTAANVNYLGRATLAVTYVTDHLPVFHEFMIVSANFYDSMFGSSDLNVNVQKISTDATAADNLELAFDDTAGAVPWLGIIDQGTAQSATGTTLVLRSAAVFADDTAIGATLMVYGSTQGYWQSRTVTDYVLSTDTATVDTWTVTPSGTITYKLFAGPPASTSAPAAVNVTQWLGTACATPTVAGVPEVDLTHVAGATTNVSALATNVDAILTDTGTTLDTKLNTIDDFLDTEIAAILADTNELQTDWANGGRLDLLLDSASSAGDPWGTALPGAYGAGTAGKIVGDNLNATVSSRASQTSVDTVDDLLDTELAAVKTVVDAILVDTAEIGAAGAGLTALATAAALDTVDNFLDTEVAAIKAKTDSLTFTVAGQVDANIQYVNDVALVGDGSATPWGPA